jgi:hypothetical protein
MQLVLYNDSDVIPVIEIPAPLQLLVYLYNKKCQTSVNQVTDSQIISGYHLKCSHYVVSRDEKIIMCEQLVGEDWAGGSYNNFKLLYSTQMKKGT